MLRLFRFLITGSWHEHKWKILRVIDVYDSDRTKGSLPIFKNYHLQCEICEASCQEK